MARVDQIAKQFTGQINAIQQDVSESGGIISSPEDITADTTITNDFPNKRIDASGGDIQITLFDAEQIPNFEWNLQRIDTTNNAVTFIAENPAHFINGLTEWRMYPYETITIKSNTDSYSVK